MVIAPDIYKVYAKFVLVLIHGGEAIAMISAILFHINTKNKPLYRFVNRMPLYICISVNAKETF